MSQEKPEPEEQEKFPYFKDDRKMIVNLLEHFPFSTPRKRAGMILQLMANSNTTLSFRLRALEALEKAYRCMRESQE